MVHVEVPPYVEIASLVFEENSLHRYILFSKVFEYGRHKLEDSIEKMGRWLGLDLN